MYDELDDFEYPDENDGLDDDGAETLPCPECGSQIYEEAEQCPICGAYVTFDRALWTNRPWWWILLGLLGMAAVVAGLVLFR